MINTKSIAETEINNIFSDQNRLANLIRSNQPVVINGKLAEIISIPGFVDLTDWRELLKHYHNPIMAIGGPCLDYSEGLLDRFFISPSRAKEFYQAGATLEFDFVNMFVPMLKSVLEAFLESAALPRGTFAKSIVYASPRSGGFPAHFDAYSNFVFQIDGEKSWQLAENRNISNTVVHYDLADYPYLPFGLRGAWQGDEPVLEWQEYILQPGDILFVPRSWWHKTTAGERSLSINITISHPNWLDAILSSLREELIKQERFRAFGLTENLDSHAELIKTVMQTVAALKPADIAEQLNVPQDQYQMANLIFRQTLQVLADRSFAIS